MKMSKKKPSSLTYAASTPTGSTATHNSRRHERQSGNAQIKTTPGSSPVNPLPSAVITANAALADGTYYGSRYPGSFQPDSTLIRSTRASYVPSHSIPYGVSPAPSTGDSPSHASGSGALIAAAYVGGFVGGSSFAVAPVGGGQDQAPATHVGNTPTTRVVTRSKSGTTVSTAGDPDANANANVASTDADPTPVTRASCTTKRCEAVRSHLSRARTPRLPSGESKATREYPIKGCIALRLNKDYHFETLFVWDQESEKPSWVPLSFNEDRDEVAQLMRFIDPNKRPYNYTFPESFEDRALNRDTWRQQLKVLRKGAKQKFPDLAQDLNEYERRGFEVWDENEASENVKGEEDEQNDIQIQNGVQEQGGHQMPEDPQGQADLAESAAGNIPATEPSSKLERPFNGQQRNKSNGNKRRRPTQTAVTIELSDSSSGNPPKRNKKSGRQ